MSWVQLEESCLGHLSLDQFSYDTVRWFYTKPTRRALLKYLLSTAGGSDLKALLLKRGAGKSFGLRVCEYVSLFEHVYYVCLGSPYMVSRGFYSHLVEHKHPSNSI